MNIDTYQADLDGKELRVAIVVARFNRPVCDGLLKGCTDELERLGVAEDDVLIVSVAGALEIPLALQKLANLGSFDALVALGAVIRGETYHFEIVSNEMAAGINRVGLDTGMPIANGVLTCENDAQALARMIEKGSDCAKVAVEMANLCSDLQPADDSDATDADADAQDAPESKL
jgi:6,7-dimethyl-8-ribityllumazine synthase